MNRSTETAAGGLPAGRWELAPYALVRTAGVSLDVVAALRFTRCVEQLDRAAALRQALLRAREAVSETLHAEVREHREHAPTRVSLIELRRHLYALKRPQPPVLERARAVLSPEAQAEVEHLCRGLEEMEELHRGFDALLDAEHMQKLSWLRGLIRSEEDFQAALEIANPSVGGRLDSYLSAGAGSSHRKVLEQTLISYLIRGAVKTSPLSRFAWTSALTWPPPSGAHLRVELDPGSFRSVVELHRSTYRVLLDVLLAHEQIGPRLRFQLNPDMQERGEHAFLFTRERTDRITERFVRVPLRASHRALLQHMRRHGPISLLSLAETLAGRLSADQVLPQLGKLVDSGLLVPRLAMGDDQTDPLGHLAAALRETKLPVALTCAEHLEAARDVLSRQHTLAASARPAGRARVQRSLEEALILLAPARPPALPPHLLGENAVADVRHCTAPAALIQPESGGADVVAELALFLQESTEVQLRDVATFVRRYGVGGTCEDVYAFLLEPPPPPRSDREVERYLQELGARCDRFQAHQRAFFQQLLERVQAAGEPEEVRLEPEWVLQRLHPHPFRAPTTALALLLQAIPRENAYVLNAVFPGQGALLSRFAPQVAAEGAGAVALRRVQEMHRRLASPGRPVQLVLASNYSVGAFPPLTEEALYVPGAPPAMHDKGELRLKDVRLRHEASRHRLQWVDSAGELLSPLQLGVVAIPLLPPISQRITRLDPQIMVRHALAFSLEALAGPASSPVRVWPRLRVGQFILSRRTWMVHDGEALRRRKNERELDYWLRLRQWVDDIGLPRRFFLYPRPSSVRQLQSLAQASPAEQAGDGRLKPQFIDLDNAFLVRCLEKLTRKIELPCCLQEALPTPEDAVATVNGRPHAMELCLELLSPAGA